MKQLALLFAALATAGAVAVGLDPSDIREWPVPWERTRPRDPYVGPDGKVWFVGQQGHYVAYFVPGTGEFKRYELEPGTGPHNLIVDQQGFVWYAGNLKAHIGKLDPKDGSIKKFDTPGVRDPHTLIFDQKGDIWFTAQGANHLGKLTVATGNVQVILVPTPNARPYGIWIDSKGRPWAVLFNSNKIATVDPATMQIREVSLPRPGTRPRRLVITSDDRIWYGDYAEGYLGRYDPATGEVKEWLMPGGARSRPYGMSLDDKDRVWLVEMAGEGAGARFVGFDTKKEEFFSSTPVSANIRHMYYDRPAQEIWFGTDAGNIGRAKLP